MNKTPFTFIDLFSGIGSFHYSLKQLGGECVLACDIDKNANSTYIFNYGVVPHQNIFDLQLEQIPNSDLLCAGFPCQAFSNIGFKKGWKDSRSQVFYQLLKILKYKKIPCIVLENVPGLVNLKKGQVFDTILTHLKNLNYECSWKILNCLDYGIPQNRKRVFIVGFHKSILESSSASPRATSPSGTSGIGEAFEFPTKTNLSCTLSELLNKKLNQEVARTIRIGGRGSPLDSRYNWDGYILFQSNSTTEYRLSIKDCLVLQNFSKNFQLCGCKTNKYKQIGNTIPTNLSFAIGKQVIKFLKKKKYFQHRNRKNLHNPKSFLMDPFGINQLNFGEFGEFFIKAQLLCFKNQNIQTVFGDIQKLENTPGQLIQNKKLTLFQLYTFTNIELKNCFEKSNIFKAKNSSKADVFINNRGLSIKILEKGYPTIINHTHRQNFLQVLEYLKLDIQILDICILEYHNLCQNNKIGEDIINSHPLSPFYKFKSYFTPILQYFLFNGSGRGLSELPAEIVLFVKKIDSCDIPQNWFWFSNSQQFIDEIWDFLIFSIRDKGLNYEKRSCESKKKMAPWIDKYKSRKTQKIKKKGCLHVRIHKSFGLKLQNTYKFFP
uniref:Cytosine-specific methyltransferase n=1 Tax=Halimeda discoidea TaxID=118222 RepID=A0A1C9JB18_9CHLO|nr:hypothetical protein [Halimeda discoidea]